MSWYVIKCRSGQEELIVKSCRQYLSHQALEAAFTFQCERLWKKKGNWKIIVKNLFPGYIFLQSSFPQQLSEELKHYRTMLQILEDKGYLFSIYEEEETYLRKLCGEEHFLALSYGYHDRENGKSCITKGPLKNWQSQIKKIDWHRRFAQLELALEHRKAIIWVGVDITDDIKNWR